MVFASASLILKYIYLGIRIIWLQKRIIAFSIIQYHPYKQVWAKYLFRMHIYIKGCNQQLKKALSVDFCKNMSGTGSTLLQSFHKELPINFYFSLQSFQISYGGIYKEQQLNYYYSRLLKAEEHVSCGSLEAVIFTFGCLPQFSVTMRPMSTLTKFLNENSMQNGMQNNSVSQLCQLVLIGVVV